MVIAYLYSIRHRSGHSVTRYGHSHRGYGQDLVYLQKDRLEETNETEITIPDTYDNLTHNPKRLKEILIVLTNELVATREMNIH
ncbi:hypothetical protein SB775_19380 [Peribacillus sp. SIMBA_075]|uniref:hypothetical protein n=1 Tax=Peribacillus sp. SIMBA_075 TaxID=3085813 RepID=UPI00397CE8DB